MTKKKKKPKVSQRDGFGNLCFRYVSIYSVLSKKKKILFSLLRYEVREKYELCSSAEEGYTVLSIRLQSQGSFILKLLICAAFVYPPTYPPTRVPVANPGLCGNNWIHLRFAEDSMPA